MGLNRQVCRSLTIALLAGASMMLLALMSMFSVPISWADIFRVGTVLPKGKLPEHRTDIAPATGPDQ